MLAPMMGKKRRFVVKALAWYFVTASVCKWEKVTNEDQRRGER